MRKLGIAAAMSCLFAVSCASRSTMPAVVTEEGMVAYWRLDEGSGDVLHDRSGTGNHATIHGAKWVPNGEGYALDFDGIDDFVDCGDDASLNLLGKLSLEAWAWIEPQVKRGEPGIIGKAYESFGITQYGGMVHTYISGGPNNIRSCVPQCSWHHLASTYDGKVLRLYTDGQLANEHTFALAVQPGKHFWMGRSDGELKYTQDSHFRGRITEVRVYNRVLTHDEILNHFRTTNLNNGVTASAIAVPWQNKVVAEVNVRALRKKPDGFAVNVRLYKINRHGKRMGTALASATARTFDVMGGATVVLPGLSLASGEYVVRAVAEDAAGEPLGLPGTTEVTWKVAGRFPRGPRSAKRLNNLVTELLSVSEPDPDGGQYSFINPRTGWIFISTEGAAEVTLTTESGQARKIALKDKYGNAHEAMRWLPAGIYVIGTPSPKNLIVRAIPHLVFASQYSNPHVKEFGKYVGEFKRKHVEKHINTYIGSRHSKDKTLKLWHDQGKSWLIHCNVLYIGEKDHNVLMDKAYKYLLAQKTISSPYAKGLIADEYGGSAPYCSPWAKAVDKLLSDSKYKDKIYVPYAGRLWNGEPGKELIRVLMKHDCAIALKAYLKEQRTEAAAWRYMNRHLTGQPRGYRKNMPGSERLLIICFGFFSAPTESIDTFPHVNYKTWLDMQHNLIANHPDCGGVGGLMVYESSYTDEETVRWAARLFRHYGIEGKTGMLSEDPYLLTHVEDPDFERAGQGWTLKPAEEGSIRFDVHGGFAHLAQRYPRTSEGTNVLVTRRSAKRPNVFSTEIRNLEPGRLYNLRMFSGDFKDLSVKQKHAVSIKIDGGNIIPEKCFTAVTPNCRSHHFEQYKKAGDAWVNFHWRVFRAKGKTAKLTVTDWKNDKESGGPMGQELMYNFVQVQPYFSEAEE